MGTDTDRIEKKVLLRAPRERVWRAISDAGQFGSWFGVKFDGPFVAGATTIGKIVPTTVDPEVAKTQKPYEGFKFEFAIDRIEPQRLFSFRWHPFAVERRRRLLERAGHARHLRAGRGGGRHDADGDRVGLRSNPARTARQSVCRQRAGLGRAAQADRKILGAPGLNGDVTDAQFCRREARQGGAGFRRAGRRDSPAHRRAALRQGSHVNRAAGGRRASLASGHHETSARARRGRTRAQLARRPRTSLATAHEAPVRGAAVFNSDFARMGRSFGPIAQLSSKRTSDERSARPCKNVRLSTADNCSRLVAWKFVVISLASSGQLPSVPKLHFIETARPIRDVHKSAASG